MSNPLTISAALRRISALKGTLSRLEGRRPGSIAFRTDSPPAWDLAGVEADIAEARAELRDLKTRLAVANATNEIEVPGGESRTLISCITELQELRGQISSDEGLMAYTQPRETYVERQRDYEGDKIVTVEVPHTCALTSAALDERVTALRDRFAMLNAVVEAANHVVQV
jgi:hypothetical protein